VKPSIVMSAIDPSSYKDLTDEELAERYLIPMIAGLRRQSGVETTEPTLLLRMTIREVSAYELASLSEYSREGS
jgi:hypothetical protein